MTDALDIRDMTMDDMEWVMDIERKSFAFPWSEEIFVKELRNEGALSCVAVEKGHVRGYIIAWLIVDEIHIGNVAVHPQARRKRIAERLIRHVLDLCPRCTWAGLEVRASNAEAIALYEKLGFVQVGLRKRYYREKEDAILMSKTIP